MQGPRVGRTGRPSLHITGVKGFSRVAPSCPEQSSNARERLSVECNDAEEQGPQEETEADAHECGRSQNASDAEFHS